MMHTVHLVIINLNHAKKESAKWLILFFSIFAGMFTMKKMGISRMCGFSFPQTTIERNLIHFFSTIATPRWVHGKSNFLSVWEETVFDKQQWNIFPWKYFYCNIKFCALKSTIKFWKQSEKIIRIAAGRNN